MKAMKLKMEAIRRKIERIECRMEVIRLLRQVTELLRISYFVFFGGTLLYNHSQLGNISTFTKINTFFNVICIKYCIFAHIEFDSVCV
ncbi:MAG: hypothetical protein LBL13_02390 [Bacteroidales bacterium]|nr:hypothetical protein [Bacteroidales bacterium]